MASEDPERWIVVDGSGTVAEVSERVIDQVQVRLGKYEKD